MDNLTQYWPDYEIRYTLADREAVKPIMDNLTQYWPDYQIRHTKQTERQSSQS